MFTTKTCNFKRRKVTKDTNKYEILITCGNIKKIKRKFVVIVVYIPPNTKVADHAEICRAVSVEIGAAKASIKDPAIIVAGEFNNRRMEGAPGNVDQMEQVVTGPTRGNNTLDIIFTCQRSLRANSYSSSEVNSRKTQPNTAVPQDAGRKIPS